MELSSWAPVNRCAPAAFKRSCGPRTSSATGLGIRHAARFRYKFVFRHTDLTGFAMRHWFLLPIAGFAVLCGCYGSGDNNVTSKPVPTPPPVPPTYSIGGSIAGLSGTIVLQNNGG